MYSRVSSFLEANNVIYSRQFGFRKSYSTTHALISIVERLRRCLDDGNVAIGVFVDLQKAFDTVDHKILCHKLNHHGIRGIPNKWFPSYLSSRQQFVLIGNRLQFSLNSPWRSSGFCFSAFIILDLYKRPSFVFNTLSSTRI